MGKRTWMATAVAAFALLVGAPPALAVTPTTCSTLQTDMNAATPGEVLQLPAGTCSTNVSVTNTAAFTLEGATGGGTVLQPSVASTPIIQAADGHPVTFTLSGLTLTGMSGAAAILLLDPGEAVTITGDTFGTNAYAGGYGAAVSIQTQFNSGTLATQPTVISGNTFTGNHASAGGAVALLGSNPLTVSGNTFSGNIASNEGGALIIGGTVTPSTSPIQITGNTFGGSTSSVGNSAAIEGGAVAVIPGQGEPVTIAGNTFEQNAIAGTAPFDREGGGLYVNGEADTTGAITQSRNTFSGNLITATAGAPNLLASGAGEFILGGTVNSTADSFIDNRVASNDSLPPEGGAVAAVASASPLVAAGFVGADDRFEGNSTASGGWGGAVYTGVPPQVCKSGCPADTLTLNDSTLVDNSVDSGTGSEGGAIWGSPNDNLTIQNSIVFGNTPQPEIFGFASNPPAVKSSDVCGETGGPTIPGSTSGNMCADPKLGSTGAETFTSPTIDAGSNALVPSGLTTDIAGNPRIVASHSACGVLGPAIVDMGAYEFTSVLTSNGPCPSATPPVVTIGHRSLKDHKGHVRVKLTCASEHSYCDGTVVLKRHELVLGSAHFRITAGQSETVKVKLSSKALAKLGSADVVKVLVAVMARDAADLTGSSSRKLKLLLLP